MHSTAIAGVLIWLSWVRKKAGPRNPIVCMICNIKNNGSEISIAERENLSSILRCSADKGYTHKWIIYQFSKKVTNKKRTTKKDIIQNNPSERLVFNSISSLVKEPIMELLCIQNTNRTLFLINMRRRQKKKNLSLESGIRPWKLPNIFTSSKYCLCTLPMLLEFQN